ncbi:hypothetical protein F5X96DRAFT_643579 [Biscogniauxia mediterranea]|nr:hypothetical protein F5X96DRAFT_643579 [Biscogniauxia mediterranea]
MSGKPSTGTPSIYVDGDQQNYGRDDVSQEQKHHFVNARGYMPREKNKVMNDMLEEDIQKKVDERYKTDPTFAATMHGNQPSKGAMVDAQIQAEEAKLLKKKQEKTDSLPGKKFKDTSKTHETEETEE